MHLHFLTSQTVEKSDLVAVFCKFWEKILKKY